MAVMEIRKKDDPVLRQKAKPIKKISPNIRTFLDGMAETMYAAHGVGLAAPQVGVSKRIVVIDVGEGIIELINPEIISAEGKVTAYEGCLSIPGIVGEVERSEKVTVTHLDREGHRRWIDGTELLARALQHEIDHLEGMLFVDKAKSIMESPPPGEEAAEVEGEEVAHPKAEGARDGEPDGATDAEAEDAQDSGADGTGTEQERAGR